MVSQGRSEMLEPPRPRWGAGVERRETSGLSNPLPRVSGKQADDRD